MLKEEEHTYGPEGGHNEPLMKTPQLQHQA